MNFYDLFTTMGINVGVEECRANPDAVLLDVRPKPEYDSGHIPGSVNIPWRELGRVLREYPDTARPFYVCCKNGGAGRKIRRPGHTGRAMRRMQCSSGSLTP